MAAFFAKGRNYLHVNENDKLIIKKRADIWSARIVIEGFCMSNQAPKDFSPCQSFGWLPFEDGR